MSKRNKFTAAYFIAKLERIPANRFTQNDFRKGSKRCALGHCGMSNDNSPYEAEQLNKLFIDNGFDSVPHINDAKSMSGEKHMLLMHRTESGGVYVPVTDLGNTIKERVINALVLIETGIFRKTA